MSRTIDWDPEDALIFKQVVDEGTFTAAARALDLPKSTVSRRVSRLEEGLGVQLLRRTTRRLSLTDAGRAFHARASEAAEALIAAELAATSQLDEPSGRLRVTAPVELSTRMFDVLLAFGRDHPRVHLDLELTNRFVNVVEEGYDVALRGGRAPEGALIGRRLRDEEVGLFASPDYLAARGRPRRLSDLERHPCILFPSWLGSGSTWTLTGPRGEASVSVEGRLTLNNLEGIRLGAVRGLGVALLLASHCEADVRAGRLERILPRYGSKGAGLWVVHARTRFVSAKVRAFVETMVRELG